MALRTKVKYGLSAAMLAHRSYSTSFCRSGKEIRWWPFVITAASGQYAVA